MKKQLLVFGLSGLACFFSSCSSNKDGSGSPEERKTLLMRIDSLQEKMFDPTSMELDKVLAGKQINACQEFIQKFPEDTACAEYLFRSSDLARALGRNADAIKYLDEICKTHPDFRKIPECLFLQGYYYQEYFNDTIQAKTFYMQLISKYPKHAFVDDAQALMKMFGKSEQDIIRDFEKKDQEKKKI